MKKINFGLMNLRYYCQEIDGELYLVDKDTHLFTFLLNYAQVFIKVKMYKLSQDTIESLIGKQTNEPTDINHAKSRGMFWFFLIWTSTKAFDMFHEFDLSFESKILVIIITIVVVLICRLMLRKKTELNEHIRYNNSEVYSIKFFFKRGADREEYLRALAGVLFVPMFQLGAFSIAYLIIFGGKCSLNIIVGYIFVQCATLILNYGLNVMPFGSCNYKIEKWFK